MNRKYKNKKTTKKCLNCRKAIRKALVQKLKAHKNK